MNLIDINESFCYNCKMDSSKYKELRNELFQAIKKNSVAWNDYVLFQRSKKPIESILQMQTDIDKEYQYDPQTIYNIGCTLCQMGRFDEAKSRIQMAIDMERIYFFDYCHYDPDLKPLLEIWRPEPPI
jgi:tetratricopeptide (TPR) repeat protein